MKEKGYLLLEVVIAMLVFIMVGLSIFTSIGFLQLRIKKSEYEEEAVSVLQEGVEIAQNAILVNWENYADGEYHPAYDADADLWVLVNGEEEGVRSKYTRKLNLIEVCRDTATGERISFESGICPGDNDPNSRMIEAQVSWREGGEDKIIKSGLLSFKIPE